MKWLEEAGFTDADSFFEEPEQMPMEMMTPQMMPGQPPAPMATPGGFRLPARFQGLTPQAQQASVNPANLFNG